RSPTPSPASTPPSLHDALPISLRQRGEVIIEPSQSDPRPVQTAAGGANRRAQRPLGEDVVVAVHQEDLGGWMKRLDRLERGGDQDGKSTRLNSSHEWISYAVFC